MAKKRTRTGKAVSSASVDEAVEAGVNVKVADPLALFAFNALLTAGKLKLTTKPLEHFMLAPSQREILLSIPGLSEELRARLAEKVPSCSIVEVVNLILMALAASVSEEAARKQKAIRLVAEHLGEQLRDELAFLPKPKTRKAKVPKHKGDADTVYQFRITLRHSDPPIWRRIQVADCTFEQLHEAIQGAMGWTNSHMYAFEIGGKPCGDPDMLIDEDFDGIHAFDATQTKISEIVPPTGRKFRCMYEYDFGDSWEHEIQLEGRPQKEPGQKYPVCLDGERACPLEDVGGIFGFYDLLEALADPKHERHDDYVDWAGEYDAETFDPAEATKVMQQEL